MADEPLHEIQLNGKQLVFTFMSATVVAVVVFLCGVMVGRGVRAPGPGNLVETIEANDDPTASDLISASPLAAPAGSPDGAPPTSRETLTYPDRLQGDEPPAETLKPSGVVPASVVPGAGLPAPAREPIPPAVSASSSSAASPPAAVVKPVASAPSASAPTATASAARPVAGGAFVVQVAATRDRAEADAIVRRLTGKGYPAFVTTPASGPQLFRVRVGTFADLRQAQTTATRLEKEEQFKPWITR